MSERHPYPAADKVMISAQQAGSELVLFFQFDDEDRSYSRMTCDTPAQASKVLSALRRLEYWQDDIEIAVTTTVSFGANDA